MQVEFVLGRWWPEEQAIVQQKIDKCIEVIELFASIGIEKAMNSVNNLSFT